jgi:predicted transcriptional regulator
MPRKAKPSMVWDTQTLPIIRGEQIEFHRKVFKTVPNKLMYRLTGNLISPALVSRYIKMMQDHAEDSRPQTERRRLHEVSRTRSWETIKSHLVRAKEELSNLEQEFTAWEERRRVLKRDAAENLRAELASIQTEFGTVGVTSGREVYVYIEDVQLDGVILGSFKVTLELENGRISAVPKNVATHNYADGNPQASCHPHISSSGSICFGTAERPIRRAIEAGLLFDVFEIMKSHLHSYNEGDAHASLNRWSKTPIACDDCGSRVPSNNIYKCHCECGHEVSLCSECTVSCTSCGRSFCEECVVTCADCHHAVCDNCLTNFDLCRQCATQRQRRR